MTRYDCPKCHESVTQICTISQKHCCDPENHNDTPCKFSKCLPICKIIDLDRMNPKTDFHGLETTINVDYTKSVTNIF